MSDEDEPRQPTRPAGRLWVRRGGRTGRYVARESVEPGARVPTQDDNLVLRQLQGLRHENSTILERHVHDRELIIRLGERVEQGFDNVRSDIRQLRDEVKVLRSEVLMLENKVLNNQNEIPAIVRRLDEAEDEPFEIIEAESEPESGSGG